METLNHIIIYNLVLEDDNTLPLSFFFLQHHHRRRQWQCLLKHKTHKTHKKTTRKNHEKGGSLPSTPVLPSHFWLLLLPFCYKRFLLTFFSFQTNRRKEKKRKLKKNHREKKNCRERKEFSFKLPLCLLIFGSHFWPLVFALLFQVLSPSHLLLFKQRKRKKNTKKKKP